MKAGFELYQTLLPTEAFFHRGSKGPKIVITDDSKAEQNALSSIWPDATLLLCTFHVLQALWGWEWESKNKIDKADRPLLFNLFKELVYAKSSEEFKIKQNQLLNDETVRKYPQFLNHVNDDILPRKDEWALSERIEKQLPTHNNNTTNYVEVTFRLTKDSQFSRVRAFNLADLLDIILDDSSYYVMRCLDVSGNRTEQLQNQKSRYLPKKCKIDPTKIIALEEDMFLVPSERLFEEHKVMYTVNMNLSLCQCTVGMLHGPCKHKQLVAEHFGIASPDVIPHTNPKIRALYYYLATGEERDASWFRSLRDTDVDDTLSTSADVFASMRTTTSKSSSSSHISKNAANTAAITPSMMIEDPCERVSDNDVDNNVVQNTKADFVDAIETFKDFILGKIDAYPMDYVKPVQSFSEQLKRSPNISQGMLKKSLFEFVDDNATPSKVGRRKRKQAKDINPQKTAKSRRLYKSRGSKSAQKGRPRKHITQPKRIEDNTYHCLPTGKRRVKKHQHNISASVSANRSSEKKH